MKEQYGRRRVSLAVDLLTFMITSSLLITAFGIQRALANPGQIVIKLDGSVDPVSAPLRRDGNTYTLTDNVTYSIVVQRDNVVLDGAGFIIKGLTLDKGIDLTERHGVTVRNTVIVDSNMGIILRGSSGNLLLDNKLMGNNGIELSYSKSNIIKRNVISGGGIYLGQSSNNLISNNTMTDGWGVDLDAGCERNTVSGNTVSHSGFCGINSIRASNNNFIDNNLIDCQKCGIWIFVSDNCVVCNNEINKQRFGICLDASSNTTVSGNIVTNCSEYGIGYSSYSATISNNTIANNTIGIQLSGSSHGNVRISGNTIRNNYVYGIRVLQSTEMPITGNRLVDNNYGMDLLDSSYNRIYHNEFINNAVQIRSVSSINFWDNGYPSGGNFWTDHNGLDKLRGPFQNVTGGDGITDTPYIIDEENQDNYPLANSQGGTDPIPPIADAGRDQTAEIGTAVAFDASASIDNVGIVSYEWDFGDGATAFGVTAMHTYAKTGTYIVVLAVEDAAGNVATHKITITISQKDASHIVNTVAAVAVAATVVAVALFWIRRRRARIGPLKKTVNSGTSLAGLAKS